MRNRFRLAVVFVLLGVAKSAGAAPPGTPWSGRVPPPARLEVETEPLARAPERTRRPVEVIPEASVLLSSCEDGAGRERCEALGPGVGFGLSALHRPSPYFAFGGGVSYARSSGGFSGAESLVGEALGLGLVGRVYLLEKGDLDPYLELGLGWSSFETTLSYASGSRVEDSAFGPMARPGGGVDYVVGDGVRIGLAAGLSVLVLGRREHCEAGRCVLGTPTGGAMNGALVGSLRITLLFGDPL